MTPRIKKTLFSSAQIKKRVRQLGQQISRDYAGKNLMLVAILKGSIIFFSDLLRNISIPCTVDFMSVASYGLGKESSGVVRLLMDLKENPQGKDIVVVEDILDSGLTLQYLLKNLKNRKPRSIQVCVLLDKTENRKVKIQARYRGFKIKNQFVVGYGLDHAEYYRNLPHIGILDE